MEKRLGGFDKVISGGTSRCLLQRHAQDASKENYRCPRKTKKSSRTSLPFGDEYSGEVLRLFDTLKICSEDEPRSPQIRILRMRKNCL
ncbi:hypothetical protein L484_014765 [Morus notabilis]|uniref:Uncharacterized protein n=1 Tax=Morus notabilis TaxID=981085 RepID=W9SA56_9ROSA|nr:hypothetical protein L484_014765 [Morus notabilis]